ncbi:hypothetical protein SAMN05421504_101522 [Amycolatopsis xylanica]|uniref:DUF4345 domain-containing protein n=1 Tax=Amycolatopsis xylanica TaxID=589385 RepID=A0A1H2TED1_9PSEU|nr:hypothetical protein [Amycolatopsis xylanica]SDW41644.1 hypothetical protein SAMN05421504_101522 [Amycolatopsis xylanica]
MSPLRSLAPRLAVAGCLGTTGFVHAELYLHGYRVIPFVGKAFLWQASGSLAVASLLLLANPGILRLAAAALSAGALGGFVLSRTIGIFGFVEHGWQPTPQALVSVLAELATLAFLAIPFVLDHRARSRVSRDMPM